MDKSWILFAVSVGIVLTIMVSTFAYIDQRQVQREQYINNFANSLGLTVKHAQIDSPNLIIVAQTEQEFRQAIQDYQAKTVYMYYLSVYVYSNDLQQACRYTAP